LRLHPKILNLSNLNPQLKLRIKEVPVRHINQDLCLNPIKDPRTLALDKIPNPSSSQEKIKKDHKTREDRAPNPKKAKVGRKGSLL
jgi:hypothetical protein